jgi:hypothetical protein
VLQAQRGQAPVEDPAHRRLLQAAATDAQQQRVAAALAHALRPAVREPAGDGVGGRLADRHEPLLAALPEHADGARVDVGAIEAAGLADTQAAPVQQLEQRAVAAAGDRVGPGRVQQAGELGLARHVGQPPLAPRPRQLGRRIGAGPAGGVQPAVERAQGRQGARPRGGCEAARREVGGVRADVRAGRGGGRPVAARQPGGVRPQVGAVGAERRGRCAAGALALQEPVDVVRAHPAVFGAG